MIQQSEATYRGLGERQINCAEGGFTTESSQVIEASHAYLSPWRNSIEEATDYAINMAKSIGANAFSEREVFTRWYFFNKVYRVKILASIYSVDSNAEWQQERLNVKVESFKENSPMFFAQVADLCKSQAAMFNMTNTVAIVALVCCLTSFFS